MRKMFLLVVGLFGGALFSQAPAFVPQYLHNLDGEIAGISDSVREAGAAALPRQAARGKELSEQRDRIEDAGEFMRIVELARGFDVKVATRSTDRFEPALPLNAEGVVSTVAGFLAGRGIAFLLVSGLLAIGALFARGRRGEA